jgi:hypothetical protein
MIYLETASNSWSIARLNEGKTEHWGNDRWNYLGEFYMGDETDFFPGIVEFATLEEAYDFAKAKGWEE